MWSEALIICAVALGETVAGWGGHVVGDYQDRLEACEEVAERAVDYGVPQELAVSLGMEESGYVAGLKSKVGAVGPLQVIPHHHCPGRVAKGCDLVGAGFEALKKYALEYGCGEETKALVRAARFQSREAYLELVATADICREPDWTAALCHYNGGERCFRQGRGYAKRIQKRARALRKQMVALVRANLVRHEDD